MIKTPLLTVDIIIEYQQKIVLIRRKNDPFKGHYALPGGFVDVGETVENAAIREAKEETGLDIEIVGLVGIYSDRARDARGHTVSMCYAAKGRGHLSAGSDAYDATLFPIDELPELAFDHSEMVHDNTYHTNGDSMNYEPNTVDWEVGDLVIHDDDEKSERMLMRVIEIGLPFGMVGTEYVNDRVGTQHRECFLNSKQYLHDPMRFDIGAPIAHAYDESESWEIYSRALNEWGVGLQLDMFIEEGAEAIQAVQHYKRGRCDMDTVCGELADLQIMLEQMKIVYGTDRFEKIFAEKIVALDERLDAEEQ